jgi:hypothetical protein
MPVCSNCGDARADRYCPHCGQRVSNRLAMGEFMRDVADDQVGVDRKLPLTLRYLFFRPGFLTYEYVNGRIARYIPPFRLYIISSLVFFLTLSMFSNRSDWAEVAEREIQAQADTARAARDTANRGLNVGLSVGDRSWIGDADVNLPWKWLDQRIEQNLDALGKLPPSVALRRMTDATIEEAPKVMFVLLPVFAVLLKILYVRRKRFYIEHFVFALHFHACAFILFTLAVIGRAEWMFIAIAVILPIYGVLAMKRTYQQGWFKTLLKAGILGYTYAVLLAVGVAFAFIWALAAVPSAG